MKEFLDKNRLVIVALFSLIALATMLGYTLGMHNAQMSLSVGDAKVTVGEKNVPMGSAISEIYRQTSTIPALTKDVNFLLHSNRLEAVRNILKQYSLMQKAPDQVMTIDVVRCFEDWETLPSSYKTGDLPIKYEALLQWYKEKQRSLL